MKSKIWLNITKHLSRDASVCHLILSLKSNCQIRINHLWLWDGESNVHELGLTGGWEVWILSQRSATMSRC